MYREYEVGWKKKKKSVKDFWHSKPSFLLILVSCLSENLAWLISIESAQSALTMIHKISPTHASVFWAPHAKTETLRSAGHPSVHISNTLSSPVVRRSSCYVLFPVLISSISKCGAGS